jgi:hypothetical protein
MQHWWSGNCFLLGSWWCVLWCVQRPQRCSLLDPAKFFSHPSLAIYRFATPPIKEGLQIGGRLLIANHLNESLWLADPKQGVAIRSYLWHSSLSQVHSAVPFTGLSQQCKNAGPNLFAESNQHVWTFLHPILRCTITHKRAGDALTLLFFVATNSLSL